jgi:hypothetical protein
MPPLTWAPGCWLPVPQTGWRLSTAGRHEGRIARPGWIRIQSGFEAERAVGAGSRAAPRSRAISSFVSSPNDGRFLTPKRPLRVAHGTG